MTQNISWKFHSTFYSENSGLEKSLENPRHFFYSEAESGFKFKSLGSYWIFFLVSSSVLPFWGLHIRSHRQNGWVFWMSTLMLKSRKRHCVYAIKHSTTEDKREWVGELPQRYINADTQIGWKSRCCWLQLCVKLKEHKKIIIVHHIDANGCSIVWKKLVLPIKDMQGPTVMTQCLIMYLIKTIKCSTFNRFTELNINWHLKKILTYSLS